MSRHSKYEPPSDFSLWCNERVHSFPAATFSRVSKKCAALVKANDYQGAIDHPVKEETFNAFSDACRLKPFKVTLTNAFELLDLAREWGIPSLEAFVRGYIKQKGLIVIDDDDYLTLLLQHAPDSTKDISSAIAGVARNFNKYLRDERLAEVHPEHLFKVLIQAEHRKIDQQLLIDFVMKLLESQPEKAVPLCLRIDFDRLTSDQIETIFQTREIHEQAMGYFIANALSSARDKQQYDLTESEQVYIKEIQDIREYILKHRTVALAKIQDEFEDELRGLNELIESQKKQLEELREIRIKQLEDIDQESLAFEEQMKKFDRELERITDIVEKKMEMAEKRRALLRSKVNAAIIPLREFFENRLEDISGNDVHRRNLMQKAIYEMRDAFLQKHDEITNMINQLEQDIQAIHNRIMETRATTAAKIVSDQLQRDYFIRNIDRRFDVFNVDPPIWELTSDQVREAEEIVQKLEFRIRDSCPINVKHKIQTSVSAFQRFASVFSPRNI